MITPNITEAMLRNLSTPQSFERGEDYYHSSAVYKIIKRGSTLHAQVEGTNYDPYEVVVELENFDIDSAYCTCPYDWGGYCKHIVAVLLTYIRNARQITERPAVAEILTTLNQETLLELLTDILTEHPGLIDWVEARIALK